MPVRSLLFYVSGCIGPSSGQKPEGTGPRDDSQGYEILVYEQREAQEHSLRSKKRFRITLDNRTMAFEAYRKAKLLLPCIVTDPVYEVEGYLFTGGHAASKEELSLFALQETIRGKRMSVG